MRRSYLLSVFLLCVTSAYLAGPTANAAEEPKTFEVGGGKISLTSPAEWEKVEPKNRIIEHEFSIKSAEGDKEPGRTTVMGAAGTVEANIERWIGQFSQADGSDTKDKAKTEKKTIGGLEVHFVDISGTYKDAPAGPFAGGKVTERPDYRMLAAIVQSKNSGNYFIKFYGPAKTVAENEKAFKEMMESVKEK